MKVYRRELFYVSISVWSGCDLGWAFYVFVFLCFWPGVVLNQGQLSIVVSDWELYLGSFPPPPWVSWVVIFCLVFAPYGTVSV
jgi:hypothetical protein